MFRGAELGLKDVIKQAFSRITGRGKSPRQLTWSDIRPAELDWMTRGVQDIAKLRKILDETLKAERKEIEDISKDSSVFTDITVPPLIL